MKTPCYIFDIDGTIANNKHRTHFLEASPKDWDGYHALAHLDTPFAHIKKLMANLNNHHKVKNLSGWPKAQDKTKIKYLLSYCRDCRSNQIKTAVNKSVKSNLKQRWQRLRVRSVKIGIPFCISFDDFAAQLEFQDGRCFYTDQVMKMDYGDGHSPLSCSVDKVEPIKGYCKGNIVFCCNRINTIKSDVTLDEMKSWMPSWYKRVKMWRENGVPCAQVAEGDF